MGGGVGGVESCGDKVGRDTGRNLGVTDLTGSPCTLINMASTYIPAWKTIL